jgi:hypothetical protein
MSTPALKTRPSSETPNDPRHKRPTFAEQVRNVLQFLLLMGAVLGALWWIERAAL